MRPVEFGNALAAGCRLTLVSHDKPARFFRVIKFWMDETSGIALALKTGVPSYQVEDDEGRIHVPKKSTKTAGAFGGRTSLRFDPRSIFDATVVEE